MTPVIAFVSFVLIGVGISTQVPVPQALSSVEQFQSFLDIWKYPLIIIVVGIVWREVNLEIRVIKRKGYLPLRGRSLKNDDA